MKKIKYKDYINTLPNRTSLSTSDKMVVKTNSEVQLLSNIRNDLLKYADVDTLVGLLDVDRWEIGAIYVESGANDDTISAAIRTKYGILLKSGKTYEFVNPAPGMLYIFAYNIDGSYHSQLEALPAGTTSNRLMPSGVRFIRIFKIGSLSSIPTIKIREI